MYSNQYKSAPFEMNWARDDDCLHNDVASLESVFRYEPRDSVVIKITKKEGYRLQIWSLMTDEDWLEWLDKHAPSRTADSGLVLVLAKRAGEPPLSNAQSSVMSYTEWLEHVEESDIPKIGIRRTQTFAALSEKPGIILSSAEDPPKKRQPSIRTLPFSYKIFRSLCRSLQVHASIIKTMTRTDVPSFTWEKVLMGSKAHVYNCRTPNSWPSDMALSATHFPENNLTMVILYGCTSTAQETILKKLHTIKEESLHPLLMPGIFAELELVRHISLAEASIVSVETKIFELDIQCGATQSLLPEESRFRKEGKRTAWLDLTYLRNSLITWNTQIGKMRRHTKETNEEAKKIYYSPEDPDDKFDFIWNPEEVGEKIEKRLDAIHEEYEEKIRDCSMRLDGMAMATQWSHSETAVEMALATNRESRVMKSISLVTMVFLPGTFFATVFSMSFFNWNSSEGKSRVSSYLWIYVAVTAVFTAITLGMWYYFVIHRRSAHRVVDEEQLGKWNSPKRAQIGPQVVWSKVKRAAMRTTGHGVNKFLGQ